MAKCSKCKKDVSYFSKMEHKGKIYCNPCYNKMIKQENIKKKKEKDISHAKKSILKEYNFDKEGLITHMVKSWKPINCKTELQYTNSLKTYLDKELSADEIYVGTEHGLDISRLDLVVGKKKPYKDFAIELKKDLKSSSEFNRLKGQIHTYATSKFKNILIILTGKTEQKLETELRKYFKDVETNYSSVVGFRNINLIKVK